MQTLTCPKCGPTRWFFSFSWIIDARFRLAPSCERNRQILSMSMLTHAYFKNVTFSWHEYRFSYFYNKEGFAVSLVLIIEHAHIHENDKSSMSWPIVSKCMRDWPWFSDDGRIFRIVSRVSAVTEVLLVSVTNSSITFLADDVVCSISQRPLNENCQSFRRR